MEKDPTIRVQRPSYISGCIMSPPCFPVVPNNEFHYSRIHYYNSPSERSCSRWKNILRRFMRERKTFCSRPKPISFQYDPVSYSQNFDEGCHLDEEPRRLSQMFQDVSDSAFHQLDSQCKT